MLTNQQCKLAKAEVKARKLFDEKGLHLLITPTGFKSWRLKYRFDGKEKQLAFGPYPEVSLAEARDLRDEARALLRKSIDPAEHRRQAAAKRATSAAPERTFESVAKRWHALQSPQWKERHAHDVLESLERRAFPTLGQRPIDAITPREIRELLQRVQADGALEIAHRLRQRISAIYQYALAEELTEVDPAASVGRALQPVVKRRQPALLKLDDARAFIKAMEAEPAHPTTKLASRLLALTAARPGTVQLAEPGEFEGLESSEPIWRIPAAKMKLQRAHSEQEAFDFIIPLSRQAVATVNAAKQFAGNRKYLFPSARHSHRPFTDNALNVNYRRVPGFAGRHVPHGWRATFSTIMNERAIEADRPGDRAIIDLMLAHQPEGVEALYNRAAYMKRRREIAQEWADLLMQGAPGPEVLIELERRRTKD